MMTLRQCLNCGAVLRDRRGNGKYCSRPKCKRISNDDYKDRNGIRQPPKKCRSCKQVIKGHRRKMWCDKPKCQTHRRKYRMKQSRAADKARLEIDRLPEKTLRRSQYCKGLIPPEKRLGTRWCSKLCSIRAHHYGLA